MKDMHITYSYCDRYHEAFSIAVMRSLIGRNLEWDTDAIPKLEARMILIQQDRPSSMSASWSWISFFSNTATREIFYKRHARDLGKRLIHLWTESIRSRRFSGLCLRMLLIMFGIA